MNKFTLGLLSAMAVATTILLVRQQREGVDTRMTKLVPAGETHPTDLSLERIRELAL